MKDLFQLSIHFLTDIEIPIVLLEVSVKRAISGSPRERDFCEKCDKLGSGKLTSHMVS